MSEDAATEAAERTAAHLRAGIAAIEEAMGEGYARAHPELLAAFLQSASIEAAILEGREIAATADKTVNRAVERVTASIEYLKPRLFG